jgi:6-phosphogluconolactonase
VQLIIGTYTGRLPHVEGKADGILAADFDAASGAFGAVRTLAGMRNPSYLAISASGEHLYAVSETETFDGQPGGGIVAFARDKRTGEVARLNARPTIGSAPCHVAFDRTGRFLLTANYGIDGGSVTVYPLSADGRLGDIADHVRHAGSGPHPERQASSHAHMTRVDPLTGDILVTDLGADSIFAYTLDSAGRLAPRWQLKAEPGAGPRHLAFHPGGRYLFVVNELGGAVSMWRRAGDGFTATGVASTLPAGAGAGPGEENAPGAIRISPSGRHVLVSNRGHDSISVFRFDDTSGALSLIGTTASAGECPRDFIMTPDGRRIIVASQDSDVLASYEFDDAAGALRPLRRAAAPTPVCLVFA